MAETFRQRQPTMTTNNADDEHEKGVSMTVMVIKSTNMACAGMSTGLKMFSCHFPC
jgi:hypothetical protein